MLMIVIYISSENMNDAVNKLQSDLNKYGEWCNGNKLTVNTEKSNFVIYGTRAQLLVIDFINLSWADYV